MPILALALASILFVVTQKPAERTSDPAELVRALFEADGWSKEGATERARLLEQLERDVAPLNDAAVKKWTAKCLELWGKGARLEKKGGRRFFWPKPQEKGLFFVAGETNSPKGLLIAMHGGGAGSGDATTSLDAYSGAAGKRNWLLLCPEVLEKTEHGWTDSGTEEFVLQLVDAALRTWKIDRNRVYFSGHSMGGYGTWTLGAHHADRVAGLAASAGAPTPIFGPSRQIEAIDDGVVPSLRNVRFVIFQSDDDPRVPPEVNRFAVKQLESAKKRWGGFDFEYWEVSGNAHDLAPGGMDALLAKIDKRARDPRPAKIVWQPALAWKRQFYWLYWAKPRSKAIVEAEVERSTNEVRVTCDGDAKGLEVLLDERLVEMSKEVVVKLGGTEVFRGKLQPTLATIAKTALSGDPELVFACRVPLVP